MMTSRAEVTYRKFGDYVGDEVLDDLPVVRVIGGVRFPDAERAVHEEYDVRLLLAVWVIYVINTVLKLFVYILNT